jgi:hypothetical protein
MMEKHLCIHGHFYQPPREDPWLRTVLPEGSAAPGLNWNERIARESYAPLAWARLLDDKGRIARIVNVYEYLSFNFGPTLFSWMEKSDPETYHRILDADKASRSRLGFGNALGQICHHVIMPLASAEDKKIETAWAMQDFEARFGRQPDGMWLSETAVDSASLEALAEAGIAFTILAPRQAAAIAPTGRDDWHNVDEGGLDITQPYLVELPSGRTISVFFYHGALSQAVAFEELLRDGGAFWSRVKDATLPGLLSLATDGETYGHHFTFGEMALAYMLMQAEDAPDLSLTNYAAYLAAHPPTHRVRLHEPSSWSCAHGVERWKADCGCNTGGHPHWTQRWRDPLRRAQDHARSAVHKHFTATAPRYFPQPADALLAYGSVRFGGADPEAFRASHFSANLSDDDATTAWDLLEMEQWSLASMASCAWFFDDLDRIEPLGAMTYTRRALELASDTRLDTTAVARDYQAILAEAVANQPPQSSGRELYIQRVRPKSETPQSLIAQGLVILWARGLRHNMPQETRMGWPGASIDFAFESVPGSGTLQGTATIHRGRGRDQRYTWTWQRSSTENPLESSVTVHFEDGEASFLPRDLPWNKRQAIALEWAAASEEAVWNRQLVGVQSGLHLIQPWTESQATQNMAWHWGRFWAPLAWTAAIEPKAPENLMDFLQAQPAGQPERAAFSHRIITEVLRLMDDKAPEDTIVGIIQRAVELDPELDLWSVQNSVWNQSARYAASESLVELLGFAPGAVA